MKAKWPFSILLFCFLFPILLNAQWEEVAANGVEAIAEMHQNDQWVFVLQHNGLVYRSNENNKYWKLLNGNAFVHAKSMAVSNDLLVVGAEIGFFISKDQGESWMTVPTPNWFTVANGNRKLAIVDGEVFFIKSNKVYKLDVETGTYIETLSSIVSLSFYVNENQLWVTSQKPPKMSDDGGASWTEYPSGFRTKHLAFAQGKVFGNSNTSSNYQMQIYESGNLDPTYVDFPVPPSTGAPTSLFEVNGDIIAHWGLSNHIAYRYIIDEDKWELFETPPSPGNNTYSSFWGFSRNDRILVAHNQGVIEQIDGSNWYNHSQGLDYLYDVELNVVHENLFFKNFYKRYFRTYDSPDWQPKLLSSPGNEIPTYSINKQGDYYYGTNSDNILRSTDAENWEVLSPLPGTPGGFFTVSNDSIWLVGSGVIYFSPDNGATWDSETGVPVGNLGNFYSDPYVKFTDQTVYSHNDDREIFRLNKATNKMEKIATVPGASVTNSSLAKFSISEEEMLYFSWGFHYSSDRGDNWVELNPINEDGTDFSANKVIVSPGGMIAYKGKEIFQSKGPDHPFIKVPMPYLDTLPVNTIFINSIVYFDQWTYIGLSNGKIFRMPMPDLIEAEYSGKVFIDENNNGSFDTGERPLANWLVNRGEYKITSTDSLGCYKIIDDFVEKPLKINIPWDNWEASPSQYQTSTPATNYDFAMTPPVTGDFCLTSLPNQPFQPGFSTYYYLTVSNLGIGTEAILKFLPDSQFVEILDFDLAPDYVSGDTLVWLFNDFEILESRRIGLKLKTATNAPLDGSLRLYSEVLAPQGDSYLENNIVDALYIIVGAFDPNDKQVDKEYPLRGEELTYTIRFQNTGNFPASFISIKDTLSEHLDLKTLRILAASHEVQLGVIDSSTVDFVFDPIFLPDSISNEPESHGYVVFSIAPKANLPFYTEIDNSAGIYFDFNSPIITNSVKSIISKPIVLDSSFFTFCEGEYYQGNLLSVDTLFIDTIEGSEEIFNTLVFITVNKHTNSESFVTICDNETYWWDGDSISMPGVYTQTLPNALGCDSTLTLHLSQLPSSPDTTIEVIVDEGDLVLGIPVYSDTVFVDTLENIFGCDSILVLEVMLTTNTKNLIKDSQIQVFPNPVRDQLCINWKEEHNIESIELISRDASILEIHAGLENQNQTCILTDHLPNGLYFCKLRTKEKIIVKKILVQ